CTPCPRPPKPARKSLSRSPSSCSPRTSSTTRSPPRPTADHARTSWLGIASLIVMPALGVAKRRLGARLDSAATAGGGYPEPAVRLPGRRGTGRAAGQHPAWLVVAGPGRRAGYRRPGRTGRRQSLARRGMLLRCADSPVVPHPTADGTVGPP